MRNLNSEPEGVSSDQKGNHAPTGTWNFCQDNSESNPRKVQNQVVAFHNPRNQGRFKAITSHSGLILDLKAIQPASLSEIAEEVGQSPSSVRNHLKRLTQLDLVKRVAFEHHTLYCLNGDYNLHIERILRELYD